MSSGRVQLLMILLLLSTAPLLQAGESAAPASAAEVFDRLKSMEGNWSADARQIEGELDPEAPPHEESRHEFAVTGAGSVVMEVMSAGTPFEMVNMFHMSGDDLVLTHYCAAGNQPTMKLDRERLAAGEVHFEFTGGTNLDPAADHHIHDTTLEWTGDNTVTALWSGWAGGEQVAVMQFTLSRDDGSAD